MGNIKYLVQRILQMNYGSLFQTVEKLHRKIGRSRIGLLADIIQCGLRYGAGYKDYELCAFYGLTDDQLIPQLGYIGWDIAVSETGPQLIEGNEFPGHDILQMPPHVPDKIGMLPRFRQFLPEP